MKKNIISVLIIALLTLLFGANAIYATQDFSVSPSTLSETINVSTAGGSSFTVTNTGNETISLTVTKTNPSGGAGTININLGTTTISNLTPGANANVAYTYTSGTNLGTSVGEITVTNQANTSQEKNVSVQITVTSSGASLSIDGTTSTITVEGEVDKEDHLRLKFRNTGTIDLTGIRVKVDDVLTGVESIDEIDDSDIDFDPDKSFDLDTGKFKSIDILVDVPNDVAADTYEGTLIAQTDQGEFTWILKVNVKGNNEDIYIDQSGAEVRSGVLEMIGEPGEKVDNYEFSIVNDGNSDFAGITYKLDGDLKEEFTSDTIPQSAVEFNPTDVDVNRDDNENIEVITTIPEDTPSGTYYADIEIYGPDNDKLDNIVLKVKVVGDIFISKIEYDDSVNPGDRLDVKVTVENTGSTIFRDVKVDATLFDIDEGTEDLHESSSTFLLDVGKEKTETVSFNIPEYASDGGHTLEIKLLYGSEKLTEIKEITVTRPQHFIKINSASINPGVAICNEKLYTFINGENLGSVDESRVVISSEIIGTNVKESSTVLELKKDEKLQKSLTLDISSLKAGSYTVKHKVEYSGETQTRESKLTIGECRSNVGIQIDTNGTLSKNDNINDTQTNTTKLILFGQEVEKSTVYLGSGVGVVVVLIVVSLFFL